MTFSNFNCLFISSFNSLLKKLFFFTLSFDLTNYLFLQYKLRQGDLPASRWAEVADQVTCPEHGSRIGVEGR